MCRLSFLIVAIVLLLSCGPKPEPGIIPPAKGSPKAISAELKTLEESVLSGAQSVSIAISKPGFGKQSLSGNIFYQNDRYYFKAEATLGKDVAKVMIKDGRTTAYSPIDNAYYRERSNEHKDQWGISIEEILSLIMGKYGFEKGEISYVGMVEGFYFYKVVTEDYIKKLTVRPETINITGIRYEPRKRFGDKDVVDVSFADFREYLDGYRPERVVISIREDNITIEIKINSEKLNQQLPDEIFTLELPDDAQEVSPYWFWEIEF
ncbi:MAG: DUF4292 domain-containing protein [candidate division Zixibacteria bacterium]|nr:DUF4292 domain-containing protein [candidate division Zixibacteria bacterium]